MRKRLAKIAAGNGGFGLNEMLGIAAALIIAAFIVIPGLKNLANDIINEMDGWWVTIAGDIFGE